MDLNDLKSKRRKTLQPLSVTTVGFLRFIYGNWLWNITQLIKYICLSIKLFYYILSKNTEECIVF